MDMIALLNAAKQGDTPKYLEFLITYSKERKKFVYGFVEGQEDLSFYKRFIKDRIPTDWKLYLRPAGNKETIKKLYLDFDWKRFPKMQIVFFVDKDLSEFTTEKILNKQNVYVTDNYSIENDIVNHDTCQSVLSEVYNFSNLDLDDEEKILDRFDEQLEIFLRTMIPTMSWIIHWRRLRENASLDNINLKKIFSFSEGKIAINRTPNNKNSIQEYIHCQCDLPFDNTINISSIEDELIEDCKYRRFIRGKYVLWFFIEFVINIRKDITKIIPKITSLPKIHLNLSQANGVSIIGPRAKIPDSLNSFINATHCSYIHGVDCMLTT